MADQLTNFINQYLKNDGTFRTSSILQSCIIIQPTIRVPSLSGTQYYSPEYTGAAAINWNNGNVQYVSLANGNNNLTFTNPQGGGRYLLILQQPSSSSAGTITWPGTVYFPNDVAPTLTATNSKVDIVSLVYDSVNTKYYAGINLNY